MATLQPGSFLFVRRVLRETYAGGAMNKLVLAVIADSANPQGSCVLSNQTIARRSNASERTVIRAIKRLELRSLLVVLRRKSGKRNQTNHYTLCAALREAQQDE